MGQSTSSNAIPTPTLQQSTYEVVNCRGSDNDSAVSIISRRHKQSKQSRVRRHVGKLLKCILALSCHHKPRKHRRKNKRKTNICRTNNNRDLLTPSEPPELQLHWFRSKHSLLSYALSKLAFFTRLSKDKLKEGERQNGKILKFYRDDNGNVAETLRKISRSNLTTSRELREKLVKKLLLQHSSQILPRPAKHGKSTSKAISPEEIYEKNLKRFETLVAITASTSSSSTSGQFSFHILKPTGPMQITTTTSAAVTTSTPANNDATFTKASSTEVVEFDENQNLVLKPKEKEMFESNDAKSLTPRLKLPLKRLISTSKNRVEVDVYFMDWIKKKMGNGDEKLTEPTTVQVAEVEKTSSDESTSAEESSKKVKKESKDKNNNAPEKEQKKGPFKFLKKGEGRRASVAGRSRSKSPARKATRRKKRAETNTSTTTGTETTTATSTTPTTTTTKSASNNKRCDNCGPCAGKGALSGAPPAYLDYGEGGAANTAGEAWKGKRKGDPVMDRLKNVDVVEEMTYLVPNPDCGGNGDCCDEIGGDEEDDCDYYAVCESCGEMEPVPEDLKKELLKRKRKTNKVDKTPVTYSRRQRFNFKSKGDMCDDEDGPPYPYEGLQCTGASCRCSCCVAGLRRNPDCGCVCCQSMGPARKCNSFDEIPVGKNPQIRRILCPEEECARIREECMKQMPDTSGMYQYDLDNNIFERQVPRTPTPIVVEVEAPKPLTKGQLLSLGREIQERKRLGIGVDAYCPPQENNPMYLPPIYGQCNPPCQPCCVPNYCCPPPACGAKDGEDGEKSESRSFGSSYYSGSNHSYPASREPTGTRKTNTATGTNKIDKKEAGKDAVSESKPQSNSRNAKADETISTKPQTLQPTKDSKTSSSESLPSQ